MNEESLLKVLSSIRSTIASWLAMSQSLLTQSSIWSTIASWLAMSQSMLTHNVWSSFWFEIALNAHRSFLVGSFRFSYRLMLLVPQHGLLNRKLKNWLQKNVKPKSFGARKIITMADIHILLSFLSPAFPSDLEMIQAVLRERIFVLPLPYAVNHKPMWKHCSLGNDFWTIQSAKYPPRLKPDNPKVIYVNVDGGFRIVKGGFLSLCYKPLMYILSFGLFKFLRKYFKSPASAAALVRDEDGNVIDGVFCAIYARDSSEAELYGACIGMELALEKFDPLTHCIVLEMDNQSIVQGLPLRELIGSGYVNLTVYQRYLHRRFSQVKYQHVHRDKNKAADFLAKYAIENVQMGNGYRIWDSSFTSEKKVFDAFVDNVKSNWGWECVVSNILDEEND